jgi:broad specificity phosphatase PhoE
MTDITKGFYFVRHGRTDANEQDLFCGGGWDISLNDVGFQQARNLSNQVKKLKVKNVLCSSMLRAKQTANELFSGIDINIEIVNDFREWELGDWEKVSGTNLPDIPQEKVNPPNGETYEAFRQRVINSVEEKLEHVNGETLIVSHGCFGYVLFEHLNIGIPHLENCHLYKITREESGNFILS